MLYSIILLLSGIPRWLFGLGSGGVKRDSSAAK
jgi:hypothetical protein